MRRGATPPAMRASAAGQCGGSCLWATAAADCASAPWLWRRGTAAASFRCGGRFQLLLGAVAAAVTGIAAVKPAPCAPPALATIR
jgi:hypothetical protein